MNLSVLARETLGDAQSNTSDIIGFFGLPDHRSDPCGAKGDLASISRFHQIFYWFEDQPHAMLSRETR